MFASPCGELFMRIIQITALHTYSCVPRKQLAAHILQVCPNYLCEIRTVLVRRVIDYASPQHYFRSDLSPLVVRIIQSAALPAIFGRGPLANSHARHKWCSFRTICVRHL